MIERVSNSSHGRILAAACLLAAHVGGTALASDVPGGDQFGEAVAMSGDTVVVGRPSTRPGSSEYDGAALVFEWRNGAWRLDAALAGDHAPGPNGFGFAVAISGDWIAVSSPAAPAAVHLFERAGTAWLQRARIDAPLPNAGFANDIALDGGTLLVGAQSRSAGRGAAYVYERSGKDWQLAATLIADDGEPGDNFGTAVALDGTRAVIGSFGHVTGAAYVFDRVGGSWQQSSTVDSANARPGDRFGAAVDVEGDRIAVGAPGSEAEDFEDQGAVFVFERTGSGWTETAKLSAFDGRENDLFGWSLSLDGDTLVAGAIFDTDTAPQQGSTYAFTQFGGAWISSVKLRAGQARSSDVFGNSVALDGNRLWVGAPGFQNNGYGTAYAFERTGLLWNAGERFVDPLLFADGLEGD